MQGKGWEIVTPERSQNENLDFFAHLNLMDNVVSYKTRIPYKKDDF